MAAIHDLLKQITDPKLRERIAREWEDATRHKKFGLVYEQHLPEVVPIYSAKPRRGDLVAKRGGALTETWRVRRIEGGTAHLMKPRQAGEKESAGERITAPVAELLVVKQFGDPIFPTLVPMDAVQNGPADAPWHTLIEADNYHALQLLEYLYAGKVDCIYIDPPYNTGARDWKYNNDYVDGNDGWRHSKWLSFMEKRLRLAKKLLNPHTGVLIITIDDYEFAHLDCLTEELLPNYSRFIITIEHNKRGRRGKNFAKSNEFALVFVRDGTEPIYEEPLDSVESSSRNLRRTGSGSLRAQRWRKFYPIYVDVGSGEIVHVGDSLPLSEAPFGTPPDEIARRFPAHSLSVVWPIDEDGVLKNWHYGLDRTRREAKEGKLWLAEQKYGWQVYYSLRDKDSRKFKTVWTGPKLDASTHGTELLETILGKGQMFDFPKSLYAVQRTLQTALLKKLDALVVDFFAGSGTTLNSINLMNAADGGHRRCIMVTNNELKADDADRLRQQGNQPGSEVWEAQGICRSVTWPRSKFTVLGKRNDGLHLPGEYQTGLAVEREKRRTFRHAAFVAPEDFRMPSGLSPADFKKAEKAVHTKRLAFVSMIDALPQNSVTPGCRFIVSEDHKACVLFDPEAAAEWLGALEEQDHITDFYIVAEDDKQFKAIKAQVDDLLGPLIVQEEEKRPMSAGFPANVAYFKLDFLDKDRVELGAAFREILPLLWMKAGAIGPAPALPAGPLPDFFIPKGSPFAVLLNETRVAAFQQALQERKQLRHIFIVTDAEEAYRALSADLRSTLAADSPEAEFVQLYRDYLVNFTINTRADSAASSQGGAA